MVWGRDETKTAAFIASLGKLTNKSVTAAESIETLVKSSDAVITTTPAQSPLIKSEWLHPGLHITAMGSDSPLKNEIEPAVLAKADKVIVDRLSQSLERGEMRSVVDSGLVVAKTKISELGEVCAKQKPGRQSQDEITLCDLTGTGIQDTAIANYVLQLVAAQASQNWGTVINT